MTSRHEGITDGVVVEGLSFSYAKRDRVLFENFSTFFERGKITSLLGRSGCGKSTLLHLLAGSLTPGAGAVQFRVHGVDQLMPLAGMVFQAPTLIPWRTVAGNVAFGLEFVAGVRERERSRRAHEALARVGLGAVADAFPHTLSGGMQQRVAFLRATLPAPAILLLDEPFSSLDFLTKQSLQTELVAQVEQRRPVVVFVTHDLNDAIALGDRVIVVGDRPLQVIDEFDVVSSSSRLSAPLHLDSDRARYAERVWRKWA